MRIPVSGSAAENTEGGLHRGLGLGVGKRFPSLEFAVSLSEGGFRAWWCLGLVGVCGSGAYGLWTLNALAWRTTDDGHGHDRYDGDDADDGCSYSNNCRHVDQSAHFLPL